MAIEDDLDVPFTLRQIEASVCAALDKLRERSKNGEKNIDMREITSTACKANGVPFAMAAIVHSFLVQKLNADLQLARARRLAGEN